jgi:hypothetical protein
MVFNAIFNNISATLYILAVSFSVEEAGENYRPVTSQQRNGSGRFGTVKSDSTHHFFGNACIKSGPLWFSQFSGC